MQPRGLYLCFDVDADVICRINVPRNLQFAVLCFSVVHFSHTLNFFSLVSSSLLTAPSCDSLIAMLIRGRHLVVVFVTRSTCEVHMNYKWKPELLTSVERGILAALLRDFLIGCRPLKRKSNCKSTQISFKWEISRKPMNHKQLLKQKTFRMTLFYLSTWGPCGRVRAVFSLFICVCFINCQEVYAKKEKKNLWNLLGGCLIGKGRIYYRLVWV